MSDEFIPPPIRDMLGNGLIVRLYNNPKSNDRARAFLRKRYQEGFQFAFQYFHSPTEMLRMVQRLARLMTEED